jgi:hypothetical protein
MLHKLQRHENAKVSFEEIHLARPKKQVRQIETFWMW